MPRSSLFSAVPLAALLIAAPAAAQIAPRANGDPLSALAFVDERLRPALAVQPYDEVAAALAPEVRAGWQAFLAEAGSWQGYVDRRNGRIESAEGAGIPWLPERLRERADLAGLEAVARGFLPKVAQALGVDPGALVLNPGRSGQPAEHLWLVDFDVHAGGLPVEGARVVFRVNHGNLVQLGTENLPPLHAAAPAERVSRRQALDTLAGYVGGFSAADTFVDGGSIRLLPVAGQPAAAGGEIPLEIPLGKGRGLARVWQFSFRHRGSQGTWQARVDATTGKLLELRDVNRYAEVNGGVYPESFSFANETVLPMPFADVSSGGYTSSAGFYPFAGAVSSTLDGRYVRIADQCGPISASASASGRIAFGTSAGTDCATPGAGGPGNTHAARSQFYHLNRIKEVGRGWLPANTWLDAQLTANVNIPAECNAYWDGSTVNFFRSSVSCGNTGEVAAVALHEYGHGLDDNDGIPIGDLGSAEAYADLTAALILRNSCIGPGFFAGGNCQGNGDACTSCSGVRDIDWAKHASNAPHTVGNFTQTRCYPDSGYAGPCGQGGHCESHIISEAVWDLATRDLPDPGSNSAWLTTERLWYLSRSTATAAFTCDKSTPAWTSHGCNTGSLWRAMRAVDDDDGNLANGTPNSCRLFAALDRHGIACASDPGANVCFSTCTPPAVPAVSLTAGDRQVEVGWSGAAGAVHDVYRSELGCGSGFVRVAGNLAGASFTDTGVANGRTYSYQVVAQAAGNPSCAAAPAACQSAAPQGVPCSAPAAPAGVTAAAAGVGRIQVSWNAVAGVAGYRVFRAAAAGGPYGEVGTVAAPATSYSDSVPGDGVSYFYVVRATDEECESADSAEAAVASVQCQTVKLYDNRFDTGSGLSDWTRFSVNGAPVGDWRGIQACAPAHSGSSVFRFGGASCTAEYAASQLIYAQPLGDGGIAVPPGSGRTRLSFWHRWEFETGYDGGTLAVSTDGLTYTGLPEPAILSGAEFNGYASVSCPPAGAASNPIFTGRQATPVETVVDLDAACDAAAAGADGCAGKSVRIGFGAIADCVVPSLGWFLDDVEVTACVPRGCTGAPAIGAAAAGDNRIDLTWGQGAPASSAFNVYRARGTCAAPGTFTRIASGVPGGSHADTGVAGGVTYAYRVAGVDSTGFCESDLSACVEATAAGVCNEAPVFAGASSAANAAGSTCAIEVAWPAAEPACAAPAVYNVYRSPDPGFTPSAANRIATGVSSTSLTDAPGLSDGATYHYIVRAVSPENLQEDGNLVRRAAAATGATVTETLFDSFEHPSGFDLAGWTHAALSGPNDWTWTAARPKSPAHSWQAPSHHAAADRVLVSPLFEPQAGTTLSFWHTYQFDLCWDGGTLEISPDGGASWSVLPSSAFLMGGYTGFIHFSANPIAGLAAWCHGALGAMTEVRADLSSWAGSQVKLRWHAGEDEIIAEPGWFLDDVRIENVRRTDVCLEATLGADFHTLTPCRLIDTRYPSGLAAGPAGGPVLAPGGVREFLLAGSCDIPATARALSVNVTVTQPAAGGHLTLYPADQVAPLASTINFERGQTRANNATVRLSPAGALRVANGSAGNVQLILDVNGYFE